MPARVVARRSAGRARLAAGGVASGPGMIRDVRAIFAVRETFAMRVIGGQITPREGDMLPARILPRARILSPEGIMPQERNMPQDRIPARDGDTPRRSAPPHRRAPQPASRPPRNP